MSLRGSGRKRTLYRQGGTGCQSSLRCFQMFLGRHSLRHKEQHPRALHMSDDFRSRLSTDYISVASADKLLEEICSWASSTTSVATKHPYGFWVILLRRTD